MFLRRRTVPQTPPSLVKFSLQAASERIGAGVSVPSNDQVPELMKAECTVMRTAATADPVSWQATAMQFAFLTPTASATPGSRGPNMVPGSTTSGSMRVGIPRRSRIDLDQDFPVALRNCVVVALVYSHTCAPESQELSKSGMVRN